MSAQDLSALGSVTITPGSTLYVDLGTSSSIILGGSLTNSGTVYAVSNGNASTATFHATTFTNQSGALFATLSPNLSLAFNVSDFYNHGTINSTGNLSVQAANALVNTGTMTAAGSVNLTSAIGQIVNSGTITATTGNININSLVNSLLVNNAGGVLHAYNGSINLGVLDGLRQDITALGGDWFSNELNIYSNGGNIDARVGQISGVLNTYADAVNFGSSSNVLTLGSVDARDPVYFNDAGDININGSITVQENLVIIASGNVNWTGGGGVSTIQAQNGAQTFDVHIIAGANVSGTGPVPNPFNVSGSPPPNAATAAVTVNGASGTGGSIIFNSATNLTILGANVTLAAFQNGGGVGGVIDLASPAPFATGTVIDATGAVNIIAGGVGQAIHSGPIVGAGTINLSTSQPTTNDGLPLVFSTTGAITSGNFLTSSGTTSGASVLIGGNMSAANSITIASGGTLRSEVNLTANVSLNGLSGQAAILGDTAYLPVLATNEVQLLNTQTNTLTGSIGVGVAPIGALALPNGSAVYVSNVFDSTVSVINPATGTVVAVIVVPNVPVSLASSPDSRWVYVTQQAGNTVSRIDTATNTLTDTVVVGINPTPIAVANASGKIYIGNVNDGTISVIDPLSFSVISTIVAPASPLSFGPCPCSTKIYVGLANSTTVQLITADDSLDPTPLPADGFLGMGVTPNGATAWAVNSSGTLQTINTLTNSVQTATGGNASGLINGNGFVTFVGSTPTAFVNSGLTADQQVFSMATLSAPNITLNADSDIEVATGATNMNATSSSGAVQVSSNGNLNLVGGSAATLFQLATTGDVTISTSISAAGFDFHATEGGFTTAPGTVVNAMNGDLVIASPTIVNNGQLIENNNGADGIIAMQAPRGILNVTQSAAASMTATSGAGLGLIKLNPAGGDSASITGGALFADEVQFYGNDGYTANLNVINVGVIGSPTPPDVAAYNRPGNVSMTVALGDLSVCGCINAGNPNGSGGNISATASAGMLILDGGLITEGNGAGNKAGDITLFGAQGIADFGPLSAQGRTGANGGNITATALQNGIQVIDFSDGISSTAEGDAGNITLTAPDFLIDAANSFNGSAIDASSFTGNAGTIRITSTDPTNVLQVDSAGCGCNTITSNISAFSFLGDAGTIQLSAAGGLEVGSGAFVVVGSLFGNGGTVLLSSAAFNNGPVNLQNDGSIWAFSGAIPDTGVIGFANGTAPVTVTGSGELRAGRFISAGVLDPNTGVPLPSFSLIPITGSPFSYGNINLAQSNLAAPFLAISVFPPQPNPTPTPTPTPAPVPVIPLPSAPTVSFVPSLGPLPGPLSNSTIISTDQEQQSFKTPANLYQGFVETQEKSTPPLLYGLYVNAALESAVSAPAGSAVPGTEPNSFILQSGNALVTAEQSDLAIVTAHGIVHIARGAAAFLMQTDSATIVYNLHDESSDSVFIASEGVRIPVDLGKQVIVSNKDASFDSLNEGSLIAVRKVTKSKAQNGTTVYVAEFSIPSAILAIDPLRNLYKNPSQQAWADRITRNAAIFMTVASRGGVYSKAKNQ